MKTLLFMGLVSGLILTSCSDQNLNTEQVEHGEHARMGSHGMVLLGQEDIVLSHLALYRRPHDRQILMPATISDARERETFLKWRGDYSGMVTIVPEKFDLDRLQPNGSNPMKSFSADIYQGHFERGGELKFESVKFNLKTPILHKPVTEDAGELETYTYIESGRTAYLVRDIGPRPGKDQIFTIHPISGLATGSVWGPKETWPDTAVIAYEETADFQ